MEHCQTLLYVTCCCVICLSLPVLRVGLHFLLSFLYCLLMSICLSLLTWRLPSCSLLGRVLGLTFKFACCSFWPRPHFLCYCLSRTGVICWLNEMWQGCSCVELRRFPPNKCLLCCRQGNKQPDCLKGTWPYKAVSENRITLYFLHKERYVVLRCGDAVLNWTAGVTNMEDEMLNNVSAAASQKTHCLYITDND
jgi:hypothetical protein